ncbi:E1-E2 ATPase [Streptoalloteichus tenebrarius]|uniref:E1-E2 ATPase n=1 Tax=Streptoalloteichus tenebrarius (strain ATCC 17920 / DSM 40477 / JCM 4838 / CBS 697.72 / NBRC 16177 / NCIMB 11028 / NRRL B-12390 / A12253. 1 / ISP 5477) TaxID=1933 RepID=A0ABT1HZM5_STRSD|nr:hypothetical protein [Streptoalloteichus tenebrarius]MCP2260984.1 E1-E2 ATPase [Streptoalloteichus tenebrarius]BFE98923.1 hypothetical protein GCM10020241_05990 [Streptoalloteichus tenebrarius]
MTTTSHVIRGVWRARQDRRGPAVAAALGLAALGLAALGLAALGLVLAAGEPSLVVVAAVVLVGGHVLQVLARRWAGQDLRRALAATPRWANQRLSHAVRTVPVARVAHGDLLVVRQGELVPVDGRIAGVGLFDESALGGGAPPVWRSPGTVVRAGATNLGPTVELWATANADDSAHAALRRAIEALRVAEDALAGNLRRLGVVLSALAVLTAAFVWVSTGEPSRSAAILLVATPVPLLSASLVAVTAGASRAVRRGVLNDASNPLAVAITRRARRCALAAGSLTLVTGAAAVVAAFGQLAPAAALAVRAVVDVAALGAALAALFPPLIPTLRTLSAPREGDTARESLDALLGLPG